VIRNLSGMWKILFPKKPVAYLDMPQNFDAHLGGRFYALELRRIAQLLEEHGARALTDEALLAAIGRENERSVLLDQLDRIRRDEPWRVRASEAYIAARAGTLLPVDEHIALLRELIPALRERPAKAYDNARVLVVGSFCEQPPPGLIKTLEQSGCDIISDDFNLGLRAVQGKIALGEEEDPLVALARAFLDQGTQTACRYIGKAKKGAALVEAVKSCRADGVVFLAASFCDPALLDQPMLEAALDEGSIPHTSVKFAENTGQFQAVREQAGAFGDSLKLWGAA